MTFSSVFLGVATALMVKVFPLFTVFVFGTPVSFVVLIFVTLTVTITFLLPAFTVIFAVPTFFPVITPLEFTAAILLLEELYVILSLLVTGFRTGFRVTFFPLTTLTVDFRFVIAYVVTLTVTSILVFTPLFNMIVTHVEPFLFFAVSLNVPFLFTLETVTRPGSFGVTLFR